MTSRATSVIVTPIARYRGSTASRNTSPFGLARLTSHSPGSMDEVSQRPTVQLNSIFIQLD